MLSRKLKKIENNIKRTDEKRRVKKYSKENFIVP